MEKALLISIGNELLSGKTVNTNATYLAEKLTNLGFFVEKIITIPDDKEIVSKEISQSLLEHDYRVILITGGLGPTWDDSTSMFLAQALNTEIELNQPALSIVTRRYKELFDQNLVNTAEITPERKKMAMFPIGAQPIDNPIGTAPGIFLNLDSYRTLIFCLPGVPKEMQEMYFLIEPKLIGIIKNQSINYYELEFTTDFKDESLLAPYLEKVRNKFDVWIKSMPKTYQEEENIHVIISKTSDYEKDAKDEVYAAKNYLEQLFKLA